jgi:hypothetical protein
MVETYLTRHFKLANYVAIYIRRIIVIKKDFKLINLFKKRLLKRII